MLVPAGKESENMRMAQESPGNEAMHDASFREWKVVRCFYSLGCACGCVDLYG